MSWLCRMGLHDWVYVWDHDYTHVCARDGCAALRRLPASEIGNRRRRKIAVAKLRGVKELEKFGKAGTALTENEEKVEL